MKQRTLLLLMFLATTFCWSDSIIPPKWTQSLGFTSSFEMPIGGSSGGSSFGPYYTFGLVDNVRMTISGEAEVVNNFWGLQGSIGLEYGALKLSWISASPEVVYSLGESTFGFGDGSYLTQGLKALVKGSLEIVDRLELNLSTGVGLNFQTTLSKYESGQTKTFLSVPVGVDLGFRF